MTLVRKVVCGTSLLLLSKCLAVNSSSIVTGTSQDSLASDQLMASPSLVL